VHQSCFPPLKELSLEGLICRRWEIFPVASAQSDDHHSLVLLIGQLTDVRVLTLPRLLILSSLVIANPLPPLALSSETGNCYGQR
jgi:hypothetical protein